MRAQVIVIPGNETSELGFNRLLKSYQDTQQEFSINSFDASTPFTAEREMHDFDITWNYPWEGEVSDFSTGLIKRAYVGRDPKARIACAMSHFRLWAECYETKETFLVLEHDAYFIKQIPIDIILEWDYDIIGVNDPLGATRKAREFKRLIELDPNFVQNVPSIDQFNIPQGIAGNSAYIIRPDGAERVMSAVFKYGLWPNDAIMCKQLVRGMGVTKHHYTRVQGLPSTTT